MIFQGFAKITDKNLWISGHDLGNKPDIVAKQPPFYVIHTKGFTGWCSRGETDYYPPYYYIVKIKEVDSRPYAMCLEKYESGRNWKQIRTGVIKRMEELARNP